MGIKNGVGITLQNVDLFHFSGIQITINHSFIYNFDELPLAPKMFFASVPFQRF